MAEASEMAGAKPLSQIYPGRGLGWMSLGASLHGVLSRLKAQPHLYPQLDLSYSSSEPIAEPIVLNLPSNGLRLRFDGPDQRLRLIEIIDFSKTTFVYKHIELVRRPASSDVNPGLPLAPVPGPSFRHIYNRLFGPAYAGEYIAPESGQSNGTYILSYPGLAIRFSLRHKSYSDKADFVSLLTSAASPALSIAIFSGSSWPEARDELYAKPPPLPRSIALASKNADTAPDEIERVVIHGSGRLELIRRTAGPFDILLSETTPQDLIAELGPPDAIYRKTSSRLSIHATSQPSTARKTEDSPALHPSSIDSNRSLSAQSFNSGLDDDSESDVQAQLDADDEYAGAEMFYNYFHHGFDILVSYPSTLTERASTEKATSTSAIKLKEQKLVATKVFLHANVPGSYSFNRHRRICWMLPLSESMTVDIIRSADFETITDVRPPQAAPSLRSPISELQFAPRTQSPQSMPLQAPLQSGKSKSKSKKGTSARQPLISTFDFEVADDMSPSTSEPTPQPSPPRIPPDDSVKVQQYREQTKVNTLTSEHKFTTIAQVLKQMHSHSTAYLNHESEKERDRGMVLNRGYTADNSEISPESSVELLGGTMTLDTTPTNAGRAPNAGVSANTTLFGFPGLLFEVLKNDIVSCVTIY